MNNEVIENFNKENSENIFKQGNDKSISEVTYNWILKTMAYKYTYHFSILGRPIIQFPQDIVMVQELIWKIKPDLIIETGIAHGGSLILSASMLALLDYCEAAELKKTITPRTMKSRVLGIDIDIRTHNRKAIEEHPLAHKIDMIQGSSIDEKIISQVYEYSKGFNRILICLDSNHTHEHVLKELEAYAPLTSTGSYCIVSDTVIEDMPSEKFQDRPWAKGNNPKTAVWEYMKRIEKDGRTAKDGKALKFEIDKEIQNKLLITVAPDGYLRRV